MEYLLQPSHTYYRFHNRFSVNRYSMRADDFPPQKSSPNELRVLIVGDSVMYGGVRVDQSELSSEILKRNLQRQFGVPVVVGNASAKNWGPPDEFAYLKRFGTLDADVVILELSSHDYADAPTFGDIVGKAPEFPDKSPKLAIVDLLDTYVIPRLFHGDYPAVPPGKEATSRNISLCLNAQREFYRFARANHAKVALVQHLTRPELDGPFEAGYAGNQQVARQENVPHVDDSEELHAKLKAGQNPFYSGDTIHPNTLGQEAIASALLRAVNAALKTN